MPINYDELFAGLSGVVYAAPLGTPEPASESDVLDAAFVDLGDTTTDPVVLRDSFTKKLIKAWRAVGTVRTLTEDRAMQVVFALEQVNELNWQLAFDGGTLSDTPDGGRKFTPPAIGEASAEWCLVIDVDDDDDSIRFVFPRICLATGTEVAFQKGDISPLALTFDVLAPDSGPAWYPLFSAGFGS